MPQYAAILIAVSEPRDEQPVFHARDVRLAHPDRGGDPLLRIAGFRDVGGEIWVAVATAQASGHRLSERRYTLTERLLSPAVFTSGIVPAKCRPIRLRWRPCRDPPTTLRPTSTRAREGMASTQPGLHRRHWRDASAAIRRG